MTESWTRRTPKQYYNCGLHYKQECIMRRVRPEGTMCFSGNVVGNRRGNVRCVGVKVFKEKKFLLQDGVVIHIP